jgi:pimeloyl-ACP methyl ester carboxylesterase
VTSAPNGRTRATASDETPVFFPAGREQVFGVVTEPTGAPRRTAALIVMGGGFHTSVHVNRLAVLQARRLATEGYHAMRIDYHGLGESSGSLRGYRLDEPFAEDMLGAVEWFRRRGIERFVLIGSCFGGRTALETASRIEGVEAVVMITTPLIDLQQGEGTPARRLVDASLWRYLARGFRPRVLRRFFPPYSFRRQGRLAKSHLRLAGRVAWRRVRGKMVGEGPEGLEVNPKVVADLAALVRRGVPVLFIYGSGDPFRKPVDRDGSRRVDGILAAAGPLFEVRTVEGDRAYRFVGGQEEIVEMVPQWLAAHRTRLPVPQGG